MRISYSALRQNLKKTIDQVNDTHEPGVITSNNKPKAVLISYDDYQSMLETVYLLKSPAMTKRLLKAVADVEAAKHKLLKKGLIEDEE